MLWEIPWLHLNFIVSENACIVYYPEKTSILSVANRRVARYRCVLVLVFDIVVITRRIKIQFYCIRTFRQKKTKINNDEFQQDFSPLSSYVFLLLIIWLKKTNYISGAHCLTNFIPQNLSCKVNLHLRLILKNFFKIFIFSFPAILVLCFYACYNKLRSQNVI